MTESQKQQIQADAERAAQERQTPNEKCPHPFSSEQGRYWVACYEAEWNWRYCHSPDQPNAKDVAYHQDRRGK